MSKKFNVRRWSREKSEARYELADSLAKLAIAKRQPKEHEVSEKEAADALIFIEKIRQAQAAKLF